MLPLCQQPNMPKDGFIFSFREKKRRRIGDLTEKLVTNQNKGLWQQVCVAKWAATAGPADMIKSNILPCTQDLLTHHYTFL